jgi:hypothetical protein
VYANANYYHELRLCVLCETTKNLKIRVSLPIFEPNPFDQKLPSVPLYHNFLRLNSGTSILQKSTIQLPLCAAVYVQTQDVSVTGDKNKIMLWKRRRSPFVSVTHRQGELPDVCQSQRPVLCERQTNYREIVNGYQQGATSLCNEIKLTP